jgi:hypothetical protein
LGPKPSARFDQGGNPGGLGGHRVGSKDSALERFAQELPFGLVLLQAVEGLGEGVVSGDYPAGALQATLAAHFGGVA